MWLDSNPPIWFYFYSPLKWGALLGPGTDYSWWVNGRESSGLETLLWCLIFPQNLKISEQLQDREWTSPDAQGHLLGARELYSLLSLLERYSISESSLYQATWTQIPSAKLSTPLPPECASFILMLQSHPVSGLLCQEKEGCQLWLSIPVIVWPLIRPVPSVGRISHL